MYSRRSFIIALSLGLLSVCSSCSRNEELLVASGDEITLAVGEWNPLAVSRTALFDKSSDLTDPAAGGANFTLSTYVVRTGDAYIKEARVWCRNAPDDWVFLAGDGTVYKCYWPATDALNFFAYMPDEAYNGTDGSYHSGKTYVTLGNYTGTDGQAFTCDLPRTVTIPGATSADTDAVPDSEVQEFICAYATGLTREHGTVTMHFVHPFAAVEFQMKTAPDGLLINSIAIEGIHLSGNCRIGSDTSGSNLDDIVGWSLTPGNPTATFTVEIDKVVPNHIDTQLNVPIGDPHIVVPQSLKDARITIDYTYNGTTAKRSNYIIPGNDITAAGAVTEWKPGKKYTYALDFGNNDEDVVVGVSVTNWIQHNEQNIDVD